MRHIETNVDGYLPSRNLTYIPQIAAIFERRYIFQTILFGIYVQFRGCSSKFVPTYLAGKTRYDLLVALEQPFHLAAAPTGEILPQSHSTRCMCFFLGGCLTCQMASRISGSYLGLSPLPLRVTTRIITFLVGNPYKPSFLLLLGGGTTQFISLFIPKMSQQKIFRCFMCYSCHTVAPPSRRHKCVLSHKGSLL